MFAELPHSIDAEQTVIGAMILDGLKSEKVLQSFEKLTALHFYSKPNQILFDVIQQMHKNKNIIEMASVADQAKNLKSYLIEVTCNTPGISTIDFYADIVIQRYTERKMMEAFQMAINTLAGSESHSQKLDAVASLLRDTDNADTDGKAELVEEVAIRHFETLQARFDGKTNPGLETGFIELDQALGGLADGRLYVLGARPSVGKSAMGLTIAASIGKKYKNNGMYISLEMANEELFERLLSITGSINSSHIRDMKGLDWNKLELAFVQSCAIKLRLITMTRPHVERVKNFARAAKRRGQLDYLIIDHLHLMGYSAQSEVQGIAAITGELKGLALELGIPIILLAQLNRGNAKEDRPPSMTDLRGSGAIEQDADVVMLLHRDEEMDQHNKAVILLRKNRSGENNKAIVLHSNLQYFRFDNAAHSYETY